MSRHTKGFLILVATAVLGIAAPRWSRASDYSHARVVRLSLVEGDVQVFRPGNEESTRGWEQAVVNLPLQQGFTLATGNGRAEIEFESGAMAHLAENSELQFTELALSDGGRITRLALTQGTASFYGNLDRRDTFAVLTSGVEVDIPHKAEFRVDADNDTSTVLVFSGEVQVDSRAGTERLRKGHMLTYNTKNEDHVELARNREPDAFDRWVTKRSDVVVSGNRASLSYVNSPYSYGLADLYTYGSWFNVAGYGQCWQPFGVGFGWSPYWNGQWVFYPGFGWTWVSFEPWGWMPYHFGGWAFTPTYGWCWVPGYFRAWSPAIVTWVRVGNRTGWVPRAPGDGSGHPPANLHRGVVVATDDHPSGERRVRYVPVTPSDSDRIEVMNTAPANLPGGPAPLLGRSPARPPAGGVTGGETGKPGIVFDPKTRTYVNSPMPGPAQMRRGGENSGPVESARPAPAAPPMPGPAQTRTPDAEPDTRAPAGAAPPRAAVPPRPAPEARPPVARPPDVRPQAPSPRERPAPPRAESPRPAPPPQPRAESPRPSPPPRAASPRPSPPPRAQPPRPSPPPRMSPPPHMSPPRPSPARERPAPPPRQPHN